MVCKRIFSGVEVMGFCQNKYLCVLVFLLVLEHNYKFKGLKQTYCFMILEFLKKSNMALIKPKSSLGRAVWSVFGVWRKTASWLFHLPRYPHSLAGVASLIFSESCIASFSPFPIAISSTDFLSQSLSATFKGSCDHPDVAITQMSQGLSHPREWKSTQGFKAICRVPSAHGGIPDSNGWRVFGNHSPYHTGCGEW